MDKAKGRGKPHKGRRRRDIDWSDEEHFDKNRSMIYIEHTYECPIFQIKADEFVAFLREEIPERMFQLVRNKDGKLVPRNGAFEIGFSQTARTSVHDLWSGLDKGPPRRDKFPKDYESLLPEVRKILKKFYAEKVKEDEDDDEEDYNLQPE